MIKRITVQFGAIFLFLSFLFSQSSTITAEGFGMTEDAAIEQAKRAAVEIGMNRYVLRDGGEEFSVVL